MDIKKLLKQMIDANASDLFYRAGGIPRFRVDGKIIPASKSELSVDDVLESVDDLASPKQREVFKNSMDVDFAIYIEELSKRFRVSIFMQRNYPAIVIRNISSKIPSFDELNLPADLLKKLSTESRGLVLLTGSTGSGKSTTIASMIEYINQNSNKHILTVEEPIEFVFGDKNCVVNQRGLGFDVASYEVALRAFTLQSPDVIFIGNIRDTVTMSAALTAAETGVLVLSTLHTVNASQTVERIINFFPPHQHQEIRNQVAGLLKGVISLRLVPLKNGPGRIPAYETMVLTSTMGRLIREGKIWEMPQYIEEGAVYGMQSFSQSLIKLVNEGKISPEDAANFSDNKEEFALALKGVKRL